MDFSGLLSSAVLQLPMVVIEIVGIVFAIVRWRRHPMASLLFLVGATIRLMVSLAFTVLPFALSGNSGEMRIAFGLVGVLGHIGTALLISAVFVDRVAAAPPTRT